MGWALQVTGNGKLQKWTKWPKKNLVYFCIWVFFSVYIHKGNNGN